MSIPQLLLKSRKDLATLISFFDQKKENPQNPLTNQSQNTTQFHRKIQPLIRITMFQRKPTSRFLLFTFVSFLLLLFLTSSIANEEPTTEVDNEEDSELLELIEIDELEGKEEGEGKERQQLQEQKEAEVVSKAQRIVLELNSDNAKRVVDGNEYVMVLGYAPWSERSAELMPQFAEAANKLKELGSGVLMAKLDAERYPKAASVLGIQGFPTLLLFVNGSSQVYTGGFTGEDIVIWARKKTGSPVVKINLVVEAEEFLKKYQIFVLGLFEKFEGPLYKEFINAAATENEIQFAEVKSLVVAKVLFPEVKDTKFFIGLVKSEPERYTKYEGDFAMDKILQFVEHNKFPLVTRLTDLNSARVFSSPIKLQVMVFTDTDDFKSLINPLQEVAKKFKSKMFFIYVDIANENLAKPFLTLFGLESAEDTVVTAFDNRIGSKYLLELDPTPSNIEEFCSGLLHGSLSPYFKSQAKPENKEASVQVIVGKTFDDLVFNSPKNFLLEVYTPWCINCETTSKQIEKLAKHFKGVDNLVFGKIDASANEHPKLQVNDYPTLLFYPADDKANPIKLSTKSSSKDLAASINSLLKAKGQVTKDEL